MNQGRRGVGEHRRIERRIGRQYRQEMPGASTEFPSFSIDVEPGPGLISSPDATARVRPWLLSPRPRSWSVVRSSELRSSMVVMQR